MPLASQHTTALNMRCHCMLAVLIPDRCHTPKSFARSMSSHWARARSSGAACKGGQGVWQFHKYPEWLLEWQVIWWSPYHECFCKVHWEFPVVHRPQGVGELPKILLSSYHWSRTPSWRRCSNSCSFFVAMLWSHRIFLCCKSDSCQHCSRAAVTAQGVTWLLCAAGDHLLTPIPSPHLCYFLPFLECCLALKAGMALEEIDSGVSKRNVSMPVWLWLCLFIEV